MSTVMKKAIAEKMAFKHNPKAFQVGTSDVAHEFVENSEKPGKDFQISDVVAQQSGISALKKKNIDAQVEETVLVRLKEIEEQAYKQAYDLGLTEGTDKAFKEKNAEIEARLQSIDDVLHALDKLLANAQKENEAVLMNLIFKIAERIAMRNIESDQAPIVDLLKNLVAEVHAAEAVTVKLNPEDQKFIEELRTKNAKALEGIEHVKVQSSEDIKKGGCILETNFGSIDATVPQRVEKAWAAIAAKFPVKTKED